MRGNIQWESYVTVIPIIAGTNEWSRTSAWHVPLSRLGTFNNVTTLIQNLQDVFAAFQVIEALKSKDEAWKKAVHPAGRQAFPPVDHHPRLIERNKIQRIQNIIGFLFSPLSQQWKVLLPRSYRASMLSSARRRMHPENATTTISPWRLFPESQAKLYSSQIHTTTTMNARAGPEFLLFRPTSRPKSLYPCYWRHSSTDSMSRAQFPKWAATWNHSRRLPGAPPMRALRRLCPIGARQLAWDASCVTLPSLPLKSFAVLRRAGRSGARAWWKLWLCMISQIAVSRMLRWPVRIVGLLRRWISPCIRVLSACKFHTARWSVKARTLRLTDWNVRLIFIIEFGDSLIFFLLICLYRIWNQFFWYPTWRGQSTQIWSLYASHVHNSTMQPPCVSSGSCMRQSTRYWSLSRYCSSQ